MTTSIDKVILAWLLTYALHSTLLIGGAWLITRRASLAAIKRDFIWKVALVGGVVTSLAQVTLQVQPIAGYALSEVATTAIEAPTESPNDLVQKDVSNGDTESKLGKGINKQENQADKTSSAASSSNQTSSPSAPNASSGNSESANPTSSAASFWPRFSLEWTLVGAWSLLALLLALVYLGRRLILVGRLANRNAVVDGPLPAMLDALCRAVGHRKQVTLTSVNTIASPVALGFHEICLPEAALTELETDQQRGLLAHELAHLVRRDPLWLYAASLMERVFFFQPLNRLARIEMQRNAEYLCDDWAAARTGSGLPLAHCLMRVAEWIEASPLGVPVAGMAEQRSLLVTRVARLIDGKGSGSPMSKLVYGAATVVMLAVTTAAAPGVQSHALPSSRSITSYWSGTRNVPGRAQSTEMPMLAAPTNVPAPESGASADPSSPAQNVREHSATPTAQRAESDSQATEDPAVIAALIERLKDSDASVRRAAASSLGNLKSRRAVPALITALSDRNTEVRVAVIDALSNIEDQSSIPALVRVLGDESDNVRESALNALDSFSKQLTAAQILPALNDRNAGVRAKAASILGEIGDRSAVTSLTKLLKDAEAEVRHETVHALEHMKDPATIPAITPLLKDVNAEVRGAAISALKELNATIPDTDLFAALDDSNAEVRKGAVEYLQEHARASAVPVLTRLLDDTDGDVREAAVDALAEVRDPAARAALRGALKSEDPQVRRRAVEALGKRS